MVIIIFLAVVAILFIGRTVLNDRKDYIEWMETTAK